MSFMSLSYWSFPWPNNITYICTPQNRDSMHACNKGPPHHSLNDVKSIISTCNCVVIVRLRYNTDICLLQNTHNKHHIVLLKKHVITKMSFVISRSDFRPLLLLCWVQTRHPLLDVTCDLCNRMQNMKSVDVFLDISLKNLLSNSWVDGDLRRHDHVM